MNYTTIDNIEKYLTTDIDSAFEAQVTKWIAATSLYMDAYCNRKLVIAAATQATLRKFSGVGGQVLYIDECTGITAVTDSSGNAITGFETFPLNAEYVHSIFKAGTYFATGVANYSVTAKYAQVATGVVAADIQLAATILVAGIINASRSGGDNVASEKVGQYSVTYKNEEQKTDYLTAMRILDSHKRLAF